MDYCEDCKLNDCDACYESDCDCNLSDHTLAPAVLITDALAVVSPDPAIPDLETSEVKAGNYADSASSFSVQINGRLYRVTVRAMAQGVE